jgi:hypothetical protein
MDTETLYKRPYSVEAELNTSTVTLRDVGGVEKEVSNLRE